MLLAIELKMQCSTISLIRIRIKGVADAENKVVSYRHQVTKIDTNYLIYVSFLLFLLLQFSLIVPDRVK